MKNLISFLLFIFVSFIVNAQNTPLPKTETKGNLQEITLYYENGSIMQHGFYTKEGKLHASWESFNLDGSRQCYATYNNGSKVGIWTYWSKDKITKIEYDNDKVIKVEEFAIKPENKNNY